MKRFFALALLALLFSCNSDDVSKKCNDTAVCIFLGRQKLSIQFLSDADGIDLFSIEDNRDLIFNLTVLDVNLEREIFRDLIFEEEMIAILPALESEGITTLQFSLDDVLNATLSFNREINSEENVIFSNFSTDAVELINDGTDENGVTNIRLFVD